MLGEYGFGYAFLSTPAGASRLTAYAVPINMTTSIDYTTGTAPTVGITS